MTLATLTFAILLCRPSLPLATAQTYARIVLDRATALHMDPLMMVAVVDHESGWNEGAVSKDGEDVGLGQIRARYIGACVGEANPVHAPSPKCAAEKARLRTGTYNLEVMANGLERWISICKQKTGAATEIGVLTAYSGANKQKLGQWCGMEVRDGKSSPLPIRLVVRQFLQRRRALRLRIESLPPHG